MAPRSRPPPPPVAAPPTSASVPPSSPADRRFRQVAQMAAVTSSMQRGQSDYVLDLEEGSRSGGTAGGQYDSSAYGVPSSSHVDHDGVVIDVDEAEKNMRQGLEHFEANDFHNAKLGCNLAMCSTAPTIRPRARSEGADQQIAPPKVLEQSVYYKLAVVAYSAVQAIASQQKREPQFVSAEVLRRQVLLCIFLCALDVQPRHRVRFMRRTIQLMMRSGNWGLAALYLEVMRKHAQRNRGKLDAELEECRANSLMNNPGMVPDEIVRTGNVATITLQQAANHLEQARAISAERRDMQGLANDAGSLGLMYHLLGDPQKAMQSCQAGLSAAASLSATGGASDSARLVEADMRANLCLVFHAVGDGQSADESRAAMITLQQTTSSLARLQQQPQQQQLPTQLTPQQWQEAPPQRV
jgi:hypothetical protein